MRARPPTTLLPVRFPIFRHVLGAALVAATLTGAGCTRGGDSGEGPLARKGRAVPDPAQAPARPGSVPGAQARPARLPPRLVARAPRPRPLPLPEARAQYTAYANQKATFATLQEVPAPSLPRPAPTAPPESPAPPLSLTASDGSGLRLVSLVGKAVVQGPLAFTELHLTFENPEPRVREGRFEITLPQQAAVSRFAMKIGGRWMEAEVVERQRARVIYEDFLHRRQDPALLEKKAGNAFRARVFPIPARGRKEIIVSYSHELPRQDTPYRLPLRGLPQIERLDLTALVSATPGPAGGSSLGGQSLTQRVIRVQKRDYKPDRDFVVPQQSAFDGLRHENLVLARVRPVVGQANAPVKSLLVLFDTSASRAVGFARQVAALGALVAALARSQGASFRLVVACFDQVIQTVYDGPAQGFGPAALRQILARRPLGASDLHGALRWAAGQQGLARILLVTDGIATAGATDSARLRLAALALRDRYERLDVLAVGGVRDDALLRRLAQGNLRADGLVLEGTRPVSELAARLGRTTVSRVPVQIPGATWTWPTHLDGVQPGDEVLVYADLAPSALPPGQPLTVSLGAAGRLTVPLREVPRPLLERAWVRARMSRLAAQRDSLALTDPDLRAALRQQIVTLSKRHRVLCDDTALLVLESEQDYRRYGIDRKSLADILTVGPTGLEVLSPARRLGVLPPPDTLSVSAAPPPMATPQTILRRSGRRATPHGRSQISRAIRPPHPAARPAAPLASARRAPVRALRARPLPKGKRRRRTRRVKRHAGPLLEARVLRDVAPSAGGAGRRRDPLVLQSPPAFGKRDGRQRLREVRSGRRPERRPPRAEPVTGRLAAIQKRLRQRQTAQALAEALRWREAEPGSVLALVALGEALEASGHLTLAARAYGSLIDLFPSRADLRRFAGERLERLGPPGWALAADTYAEAVRQRPDHPSSHRLLAWSLVKLGQYRAAFEALERGLGARRRGGNFPGIVTIFRQDIALVAAAWGVAAPSRRPAIAERLRALGIPPATRPSLRFVLYWETDANDVDFHVHDGRGGHAFYRQTRLPSGGRLIADVTRGYGPECFVIPGRPVAFPYYLKIHYYRRGPMGYGMGKVEALYHDGKGHLRFQQFPYVIMNDGAFLHVGTVTRGILR